MRVVIGTVVVLAILCLQQNDAITEPRASPPRTVLLVERSPGMGSVGKGLAKILKSSATGGVVVIVFDSQAQLVRAEGTKQPKWELVAESSTSARSIDVSVGLSEASARLRKLGKSQGQVVLFCVECQAPEGKLAPVLASFARREIPISVVGFPGSHRNVIATITDATGGSLYLVEDAKDLSWLPITWRGNEVH